MSKNTLRLLSTALIITILLVCVPAVAENDGWLSITVGDSKSEFNREGIELGIYLLATGDYGDWTMVDTFSDITVYTRGDGSASIDKKLAQISKRITDEHIRPTADGKTDQDGKVEFKNLTRGIYFIMMLDGPDRLTMSPMLVSTPNKEGSVQIRVNANKLEYETPTPSPTPTPKPTPTPFVSPTPTPTNPDTTPTTPTWTPAPPTPTPKPTPTPEDAPTPTPTPEPSWTPPPNEEAIPDYETALGLGNIQMHVGVCFD